jgi:hypothetical protein
MPSFSLHLGPFPNSVQYPSHLVNSSLYFENALQLPIVLDLSSKIKVLSSTQ